MSYEDRCPSRAKALDFINPQLANGQGWPTSAELAAHMGWKNPSSADECFDALACDGKIGMERKYVKSRLVRRFWLIETVEA